MMNKITFFAILVFSAQACLNRNNPNATNTIQPPTEAPGYPHQAQQGEAFSITSDAFYQASLTSSTSKGRVISLLLYHEGRYKMTTDFMDTSVIQVDIGRWRTLENGRLELNHQIADKPDSLVLEFQTDGDKLICSRGACGSPALTLYVKPLPTVQ